MTYDIVIILEYKNTTAKWKLLIIKETGYIAANQAIPIEQARKKKPLQTLLKDVLRNLLFGHIWKVMDWSKASHNLPYINKRIIFMGLILA